MERRDDTGNTPVRIAQRRKTHHDGNTFPIGPLERDQWLACMDLAIDRCVTEEVAARMLREGFAQADVDAAARSLREARVDAERLVLATRSALAADGDLLTDGERAELDELIAARSASRSPTTTMRSTPP